MMQTSIIIMLLSVFGMAFIVWAIPDPVHQSAQWDTFKASHHCRLVETSAADAGTTHESHQSAYLCDDGVKYWR
jgi:hypothetical protein